MKKSITSLARFLFLKGAIITALFAAALPLFADDALPPSPSNDSGAQSTDDIGKYVGAVYKNEEDGIKIAPPLGSRIIKRAGLELVSWVQDSRQWVGDIQIMSFNDKLSVQDYMKSVSGELGKTFRAVQVLDAREVTFANRKAGRMAISMQGELAAAVGQADGSSPRQIQLFRQQLLVQLDEKQYMVLTQWSPLKDRVEATQTFEAMLTTFEILDKEAIAKNKEIAVKAGKAWLSKLTAEQLKPKLVAQPQLFRMKIAGQDVGYMRFDESESTVQNVTGILVSVHARSFPSNAPPQMSDNGAFWAYSLDSTGNPRPHYSTWENTTQSSGNWVSEMGTLQLEGTSPFTPAELAQLNKERDQLIRDKHLTAENLPPPVPETKQQFHVQVAINGAAGQVKVPGVDLLIPQNAPSFLPKTLEYLWPRAVDLTKPSAMMFAVYNSLTKRISLRTLSVVGRDHILINSQPIDCFKCLDETENGSTTIWVDADGKALMFRTSDQSVLLPTTENEMKILWGAKLNAAQQMPLPPR